MPPLPPSDKIALQMVKKGSSKEKQKVRQRQNPKPQRPQQSQERTNYSKPIEHGAVYMPIDRNPSKGQITPQSFRKSLLNKMLYSKMTLEQYLKKEEPEVDIKDEFISLYNADPERHEDERSIVAIHRKHDKDKFYSCDIELQESRFPERSPSFRLKAHKGDPFQRQLKPFIKGLKGGVGTLVTRDSPARIIELCDHPNILYLQIADWFLVHCLYSSPTVKGGQDREERAKELKQLGITGDNLYETINLLIKWMFLEPPVQVLFTSRGMEWVWMHATSKSLLEETLNSEEDTEEIRFSRWLKIGRDNLKRVAQGVTNELEDAPKDTKFQTILPMLKLVASRAKKNYRDFHSWNKPEEFIEKQFKPHVEQYFGIRDKWSGELVTNPSKENKEKVDEQIKKFFARAKQNKKDIQDIYPQCTEDWTIMERFYTKAKTRFDSAGELLDDKYLEAEKEYQKEYGPEMSLQTKKRLRQIVEEALISEVRKEYFIPPNLQVRISYDCFTSYAEEYSVLYADYMVETRYPTSISNPSPLVHLHSVITYMENILRPQGENANYLKWIYQCMSLE